MSAFIRNIGQTSKAESISLNTRFGRRRLGGKLFRNIGPLRSAAASAPAFPVDAADFDGTNDWMERGAELTGIVDGTQGIFSGWVRLDGGDTSARQIISINGNTCIIQRSAADLFRLLLRDSTPTTLLDFKTVNTYITGSSWLHFLASWDTNFTAGNKLHHLYINDVSDKQIAVDSAAAGTIDYTLGNWAVGNSVGGGNIFNGCLAEIYFAPNQYLDFSVEANRRKFISSALKPVDLGADG